MESADPIAHGLPHRAPFIFVDEVIEVSAGSHATGSKTFSDDEPFFRGHFPGDPLVPGVILAEALAQMAGIAAGFSENGYRLAAIKQMKFSRPVRPAEKIVLRAKKETEAGKLIQFSVSALVGNEVAAEGLIVLSAA